MDIAGDLTIEGLGAEELTIDGNGVDVFAIDDGFADQVSTVAIEKISIVNGAKGIDNVEELTVQDSSISGNTDSGMSIRGTLSVINSSIYGNTGNGISSIYATINVINSSIFGNTDGGINSAYTSTISVTNSNISSNGAYGILGNDSTLNITNSNMFDGIRSDGNVNITNSNMFDNTNEGIRSLGGTLSVTNSTISGNTASLNGGGISIGGTANIINTTITNNQAPEGQGSGIAASSADSIEIANSIIAGNANTDIDVVGGENVLTSLGGNVIGLGNAASVFTATRDIVAVEDPQLGELANNGGDTQTHLPLEGSPAIDRGVDGEVPEDLDTDQRGAPRITGDRVEAGSVELLGPIEGTNKDDLLLGTDLDDTIIGLGGNDTIKGADGNDDLDGGADDDSIQGSSGNDTIRGGNDNDTINGGRDQDVLLGGPDNDVLIGGRANDTLTGGDGKDQFQFKRINEARDAIADFKPEADFITFSNSGFGGNLPEGTLDDDLFVTVPRLTDLENSFNLGFVYATNIERLAFIDTESDIPLTQIAILESSPELAASNISIF